MKRIVGNNKCLLVILCLLFLLNGCSKKEEENTQIPDISEDKTYAQLLFDDSYVHEIDVKINEKDWQDLLDDPMAKTAYEVKVTIDGEEFNGVSMATKGNSSLYFVAVDPESIRYSFKLNFRYTDKEQTYHDLNKISLNNCISDPTYLKEYLSYQTFQKAGVEAPLVSFVWLRINGEDYGLYEAVEEVGKSFLKRCLNNEGVLYKPEAEALDPKEDDMKNGNITVSDEAKGADLRYTNDQLDSYTDIFENNETSADETDNRRVIEALKALSENRDLKNYLYTEEIITYFAVNNFLQNYDGYLGTMLHNYYLYECDGRLAMLPWDYNMAFSAFLGYPDLSAFDDPDKLLNIGIDTPIYGAATEQRPMWKWIVEDSSYLEAYHEKIAELCKERFGNGDFSKQLETMRELLEPYVAKDPSAFYTVEEFNRACDLLEKYISVRTESIERQLSGKLSAVTAEQDPADQVDASMIDLLEMGYIQALLEENEG